MNIARYNAGACSWNSINGKKMVLSPNIAPNAQMHGFWLNWFGKDPSSNSWDWSQDGNQRAMLLKAKARGANRFELFSNSPMWWMLYNHNPSGAADGGNNLQSWNYQNHARYLATIAKYAHDHWGIDFSSVEAMNEPTGNWWRADGRQEGCHMDRPVQEQVIHYLRQELDARSLQSVAVSASDEYSFDMALTTWQTFGPSTRGDISRVNVHGYQFGGGRRDLLYDAVHSSGKKLWMSEYCEGDASGLRFLHNLNLDMRWLHPTAWAYWAIFSIGRGNAGLIEANRDTGTIGPINTKYFVVAQYSRHIRPGMTILTSGDEHTVVAYDHAAHKLVIVAANFDTGRWIKYDLSKFKSVAGDNGMVGRWATRANGSERYAYHADTELHDRAFTSWFDSNTVQTFEVENVSL